MSLNFPTNSAPPLIVIISVDVNFFPPEAKAKCLFFPLLSHSQYVSKFI